MKKIIAPVIIGLIFIAIFISYAHLIFASVAGAGSEAWFVYLIAFGSLACAVAMVFIVIQRIREIKEEEDDDLSQY